MTILLSQGHDTTSAAVCWTLFLLGLHHDVQVTEIHKKEKVITNQRAGCIVVESYKPSERRINTSKSYISLFPPASVSTWRWCKPRLEVFPLQFIINFLFSYPNHTNYSTSLFCVTGRKVSVFRGKLLLLELFHSTVNIQEVVFSKMLAPAHHSQCVQPQQSARHSRLAQVPALYITLSFSL
jgi:hypothetical protein